MSATGEGRTRRGIPWHYVQWVALSAAVVLFAFRLADVSDGDWNRVRSSALHQFWLVALLLALSFRVRGRTAVQVLAGAMTGFFTSIWVSSVGGAALSDLLGAASQFRLAYAVPALEETVKLLPLLLVVWVWRHRGYAPGLVDFGLAGMATGAGFALHEDALWARLSSTGFDEPIGWLLPSVHADTGLVAGHVVWTGLVGLAFGVAFRKRGVRGLFIVLAVLAVVIFDHGSWNNAFLRENWRWVLGEGWVTIVLLLVGVVAALTVDIQALRGMPGNLRVRVRDLIRFVRQGTTAGPVRRLWAGASLVHVAAAIAHGVASGRLDLGSSPPGDGRPLVAGTGR